MKKQAARKASPSPWAFFFFLFCGSVDVEDNEETEFNEVFDCVSHERKTSSETKSFSQSDRKDHGSSKRVDALEASHKASTSTLSSASVCADSGYLSVDDWRSQPFYPTKPAPGMSLGGTERSTVEMKWPSFPWQTEPASPSGQQSSMQELSCLDGPPLPNPGLPPGEVWDTMRDRSEPAAAGPLSTGLARYLGDLATPLSCDLERLGLTQDLMKLLAVPDDERLFVELWDLGKDKGAQRYTAKWEITGEHGNILDEGTWLVVDCEW